MYMYVYIGRPQSAAGVARRCCRGPHCVGGAPCSYVYVYIYIYIYAQTCTYIYIYIHTSLARSARPGTANLPTNIVDFKGFDSSIIII